MYARELIASLLVVVVGICAGKKCGVCTLGPNTANPDAPSTIEGTINLSQESEDSPTHISLDASGFGTTDDITKHGFHIHAETGEGYDCNTMAGHYNPEGTTHGAPDAATRHVGDLGNVDKNPDGSMKADIQDTLVKLYGNLSVSANSLPFVIHAGEDDLGLGDNEGSLATGNAGARLACCVIEEVTCSSADVIGTSMLLLTLLSLVSCILA